MLHYIIIFLMLFLTTACNKTEKKIQHPLSDNLPKISISQEFEYTQHEFHHEPKIVKGNLFSLVYDIPYFGACGVFPPEGIANQKFSSGGGDGGMSPGTSWQPFTISKSTYDELVQMIKSNQPDSTPYPSRYNKIPFIFDKEFDREEDYLNWMDAACEKHRESFHSKNNALILKGDES